MNVKNITEEDLFTYVFFPEKVSPETIDFIIKEGSFNEILEFYRELKLNIDTPLSGEIKKKIADKIPAYSSSNIIDLKQIQTPESKKPAIRRLAAASTQLKPNMTSKSYVDNDKEFLIRILNDGKVTRVFVLSSKDEILKNFDIVIGPNKHRYHFEDNTKPLRINQQIEDELIKIEFR